MADAIRSKTFWTLIGAIAFALFSLAGTGAVMGNEVAKQGEKLASHAEQLKTVDSDHDALIVLTGTVTHIGDTVDDLGQTVESLRTEVESARREEQKALDEILRRLPQ